jgi:hypothetical protein
MTQIETLSSAQGRALLRDIYRELRFERQLGATATIRTCWQICTTQRELIRLTKRDVVVLHPLGVWAGTSLWMQEIINRHFYAPVNAVVYLGAALLLLAVGLNRTRVIETPALVVTGIVVEAFLLVLLFTVMFFSPPDEGDTSLPSTQAAQASMSDELLRELGEIGRDYAAMAVQLESIAESLADVVDRQDKMLGMLQDSVQAALDAVAPNPALTAAMQQTSSALENFSENVNTLTSRLHSVERQEVERLVRSELATLITSRILERPDAPPSPQNG